MTSQLATTAPARNPARLPVSSIRRASFSICLVLLIQYSLGIAVNLFVTLPRQDHGAGPAAAIAKAITDGPLAIAIHAGLGLAIILMALAIAIRAVTTRRGGIIALAATGLLSLSSAAYNGARFVGTGQNSASFSMAIAWAAALTAYLCILFVTSHARPDQHSH
jgi:hypothetical protein